MIQKKISLENVIQGNIRPSNLEISIFWILSKILKNKYSPVKKTISPNKQMTLNSPTMTIGKCNQS